MVRFNLILLHILNEETNSVFNIVWQLICAHMNAHVFRWSEKDHARRYAHVL